MKRHIGKFRTDESGAVTVDWVILAAGVIGLGLASTGVIMNAATPVANNLGQYMKDKTID